MTDRFTPLAPLAAAAAAGRSDALRPLAEAALAAGCAPAEVREALLLVAPFAGYPRALDAFAEVRALLPDPSADAAAERTRWKARGTEFFRRVWGEDADRVLARIAALDPEVADWIVEDAYGRVLARPGLPASERERLAVVLLAAQGLRRQLSGHVRGALRCGATAAEIEASAAAAAAFLPAGEVEAVREILRRG